MTCCRCDEPIRLDEAYKQYVHDRASGPPVITYSHVHLCKRAYAQSAPVSRPRFW